MEWRKNLYQYEAKPPENAWGNIKDALDNEVPAFREMFQDFEATPPAAAWNAIAEKIQPATPLVWYRRPAYLTAAAASVAGVIFLYTYFFADKTDFSTPGVKASVYQPVTEQTTPVSPEDEKKEPATVLTAPVPPANPEPAIATVIQPPRAQKNNTATIYASTSNLPMDPDDENYIYLVTNTGEVKRVSYKLEKMISEIRKQDGDKLRKWADKLENSAFIPAGNNFFDIAEMVRIMGEEKP